jgi:hypothetical protein
MRRSPSCRKGWGPVVCALLASPRLSGCLLQSSHLSSLPLGHRRTRDRTAKCTLQVLHDEKTIAESQHFVEVGQKELQGLYTFPLDDWQLLAGGAICDGHNVIVSAPTGAGKYVSRASKNQQDVQLAPNYI